MSKGKKKNDCTQVNESEFFRIADMVVEVSWIQIIILEDLINMNMGINEKNLGGE